MKFVLLTITLLSLLTACGSEGKKFSTKYAGVYADTLDLNNASEVTRTRGGFDACRNFASDEEAGVFEFSATRISRSGNMSPVLGRRNGVFDPKDELVIAKINGDDYSIEFVEGVGELSNIPEEFTLIANFLDENTLRLEIDGLSPDIIDELGGDFPTMERISREDFVEMNQNIQIYCR